MSAPTKQEKDEILALLRSERVQRHRCPLCWREWDLSTVHTPRQGWSCLGPLDAPHAWINLEVIPDANANWQRSMNHGLYRGSIDERAAYRDRVARVGDS